MKKIIVLTLVLIFALSLAGCGAAEDMTSNAESMGESVISDAQSATESIVDGAESAMKDDEKHSMNLMAGITANDAKKAALEHANLNEDQVSDVDIDLDRDNGKLIYEVDFNSGNTEYDYDINAETGEVISADKSKD